jgi:hypothetical protein
MIRRLYVTKKGVLSTPFNVITGVLDTPVRLKKGVLVPTSKRFDLRFCWRLSMNLLSGNATLVHVPGSATLTNTARPIWPDASLPGWTASRGALTRSAQKASALARRPSYSQPLFSWPVTFRHQLPQPNVGQSGVVAWPGTAPGDLP